MSKLTLPAWDDIQAKVLANARGIEVLTPIEQFIHNNEPCGGEYEFRMELKAAFQEVAEAPLAELFPLENHQHLTLAEEWNQYVLAKEVAPDEWIDVTERMPPPHHHIWCLNRDGRQFEGCPCYGMHSPFFTVPHGDGSASNTAPSWIDVTHWRSLPAPPAAITDLRKIDFYSGALHALVLIMSAQVPPPEFNDWVRTLFIEVKPYADHMKGVIAGLSGPRAVKP